MSGNRLLESLPGDLLQRFSADLELVSLSRDDVVMDPETPIEFVYFPTDSLISLVVSMQTGNTVEAMVVGTDGFTGITTLFGMRSPATRAIVQIGGEALRMPIEHFEQHLADARLRKTLGAYAARTFSRIAQSTGCVAFHPVEQRLARWLLMVRDSLDRKEYPLTQEFLSYMLGVHRPTVTIASRLLVNAGLIEHRRGVIRIADPEGLEQASCECYAAWRG